MNTTKTAHTPTPWHTEKHQRFIRTDNEPVNSWFHLICSLNADLHPTPIAEVTISTESESNAEFIVRACNSHQALVDALRGIKTQADHGFTGPNPKGDCRLIGAIANAALALAEGKQ